MLDINFIRENSEEFDLLLGYRGLEPLSAQILLQDQSLRSLQTALQKLQNERNQNSDQIAEIKRKSSSQAGALQDLLERGSALRQEIAEIENQIKTEQSALNYLLSTIPNLPEASVPIGSDSSENIEVHCWGEAPEFGFMIQDHVTLGENLGMMDFATTGEMSGSRFVTLKGDLARLERALAALMLDVHTGEFGYTEVSPPLLLRDHALFNVGQLPKFAEDLFSIRDYNLMLLPTAEAPLTNLVANKILEEEHLPLRFTAHTPCFRAEAGAAGRDTRGMIRVHQFYKVELVSIVQPEDSAAELERMASAASKVLELLELPYRRVVLCTGDMGFASQKTYDIEVWFPSQGCYREISSCSNCGDFQARRAKARWRPKFSVDMNKSGNAKPQYVHTLNGSGVAVGRALAALLENHQQRDGTILLPSALRPYMNGKEIIK